jgi:alanyl-tRNA synthetase
MTDSIPNASQTPTKNHSYIISDHIRAICFIISEGVMPSGKSRGYVLRRLIRRLFASSLALGIDIVNRDYISELVDSVIQTYKGVYDELGPAKDIILQIFNQEAIKYKKAIAVGEREWTKIFARAGV